MKKIDNLLAKIEQAKTLDFGTIFSESIDLFKKTWVQGLVMLLLMIALMIPFYLIMYLPLIAMGLFNPESFNNEDPANMVILIPFFLLILLFSFFAMIISFGLKAAFFRICKIKDLNEVGTDDYFYFFKKLYLGKTIKLSLVTLGISILALLLCFLPVIYVMVPIALANVIYAFNPDLSVSEIIKTGFKLGNKKWLLTFGLMLVAGFLAEIVGLMMCFIGIFVTMSFSYLPLYLIYKHVFGFNETHEINQIGVSQE